MLAFIRYSTLRLVVLLVVGAICYIVGLRGFTLLLVALIGSGIASLFVLDRQREALGQSVGGVLGRINARIDANTRSEDVDDEPQATTPTSAEGETGTAGEPPATA